VTYRPRSPGPAALRRAAGAAGGAFWWLALATPALAHGEVTGVQDVVQDYGVLLFLVATVLIGAGVLAWVTFSPQPDEEDEAAAGDQPAGDGASGAAESGAAPAVAGTAPATPEGTRASR
jgi:hypothetical protein